MFSDKIYKNFSSGCGSRTTLSVGYEPPMIFEHLCFKSSYPFHSPASHADQTRTGNLHRERVVS